ncbi:hypothetical protein [Pseudorhodobacter ferrugineus]|uniref:hypothetical protein n=1 Tax=Pseudorhodobacter ferrugineus TaxID=77008 RepID=UPI0003B707A6|nr:hypothetical protein [Pseudorhodobacter ferrugineus]
MTHANALKTTATGALGTRRTQALGNTQSSTDTAATTGRAILNNTMIGGAHSIGGTSGIPADYLVKRQNADRRWQDGQALANLRGSK